LLHGGSKNDWFLTRWLLPPSLHKNFLISPGHVAMTCKQLAPCMISRVLNQVMAGALLWKEAHEAGMAPPIKLEAKHEKALVYIPL
jgi:hypothetical protein